MNKILSLSMLSTFLMMCTGPGKDAKKVATELPSGELSKVRTARGLSDQNLISAVKTFNPTGAADQYVAFFGTGSSGRVAVVGMPSMKILKYVAVFSPEPWQGFAFDDESKAMVKHSAREDIEYTFGDSLRPALSLTGGRYDGKALFVADGANARVAVVELEDYEAKHIVTNPYMRASHPSLSVTSDTEFIVQGSIYPESTGSAVTFWSFKKPVETKEGVVGHPHIDSPASFTVLLPPSLQGEVVAGRGASKNFVFVLSACKEKICEGNRIIAIDWRAASTLASAQTKTDKQQKVIPYAELVKASAVRALTLSAEGELLNLSPDGNHLAVTYRNRNMVDVVDVAAALKNKTNASSDAPLFASIDVGGPSVDAAFSGDFLYVTATGPGRFVKINLAEKKVLQAFPLGFNGGQIMIPGGDSEHPTSDIAVVMNTMPHGRFVSVGPSLAMNAHLVDISRETMSSLYDLPIPQANALAAVAMPYEVNKPVIKYQVGTDTRSNSLSEARTLAGSERIVRNGKRVHVFATVIRSRITPDLIEVEEGDTVTIHITNIEQAQDQTHGFTIDTYNVNGSWEPGKTASVTFVADRPGVFPFYCTEFCSALHLEMQGYFMVKPTKSGRTSKQESASNLLKTPTFSPAQFAKEER